MSDEQIIERLRGWTWRRTTPTTGHNEQTETFLGNPNVAGSQWSAKVTTFGVTVTDDDGTTSHSIDGPYALGFFSWLHDEDARKRTPDWGSMPA